MKRASSIAACLALVSSLVLVACGRQDVVLVGAGDASALDASVQPDGFPAPGSRDCDPSSPSRRCVALGEACAADVDCCGGHCVSGLCMEASCDAPGTPCSARARCCSGRCETLAGSPTPVCLDYCSAEGASCAHAQDCCTLACIAGRCAAGTCKAESASCGANAECCSDVCDQGKCAIDRNATCRATGEKCNSGGGGTCCFQCDTTRDRCDPGPGPCRATGAPCQGDGDCCRGTCASGFCAAPCEPDGASCSTSAECCSKSCGVFPGKCGTASVECARVGGACARGVDCCSGLCVEGKCAPECVVK